MIRTRRAGLSHNSHGPKIRRLDLDVAAIFEPYIRTAASEAIVAADAFHFSVTTHSAVATSGERGKGSSTNQEND